MYVVSVLHCVKLLSEVKMCKVQTFLISVPLLQFFFSHCLKYILLEFSEVYIIISHLKVNCQSIESKLKAIENPLKSVENQLRVN